MLHVLIIDSLHIINNNTLYIIEKLKTVYKSMFFFKLKKFVTKYTYIIYLKRIDINKVK